jgi:hypothetical protein
VVFLSAALKTNSLSYAQEPDKCYIYYNSTREQAGNLKLLVLHWPGMRVLAVLIVMISSILSVGCAADGVVLQPPVQGEWSNYHNGTHQISMDVRESAEKPAPEK